MGKSAAKRFAAALAAVPPKVPSYKDRTRLAGNKMKREAYHSIKAGDVAGLEGKDQDRMRQGLYERQRLSQKGFSATRVHTNGKCQDNKGHVHPSARRFTTAPKKK